MSMKRIVSAALAVAMLASTMAMTVSATVQGASNATITATTAVTNPTYSLGVPKTIALALNPKEVGGKAQVSTPAYAIVNKSNVPVAVRLSVYAQPAASVKLIGSTDVATEITAKANRTDKVASLVMVSQKVMAASPTTTGTGTAAVDELPAAVVTNLTDPRNVSNTAAVTEEDITLAKSLDTTYLLNCGVVGNESPYARTGFAADFKDYTAFSFTGDLSSIPTWTATDIVLNVVYDAATLSSAAVAVYEGAADANISTNVWRKTSINYNPIPRVFGVNVTKYDTTTITAAKADLDLTADFDFSTKSKVTSVSIHTVATGATAAANGVIAGFDLAQDGKIVLNLNAIYKPVSGTTAASYFTGFKTGMNTFYLKYTTADGTFIEPISIYFY